MSEISQPFLGRSGPRPWRVPIIASAISLWAVAVPSGSTRAGSVIMKNGYIIQGPVVDRDDDSLVLGWENGRLAIHWRFIETVSYDPGEEESIRKRAEERKRVEERVEAQALEAPEREEIEDLPADFGMFVRLYGGGRLSEIGDASAGSTEIASEGETTPGAGETPSGSDLSAAVGAPHAADASSSRRADPVSYPGGGLALRPPEGWEVRTVPDAIHFVGPASPAGVRAALNVVKLERGGLSASECAELVKEEQKDMLLGLEVLHEGERRLGPGGPTAYEVASRGVFDGSVRIVRQALVLQADVVWVISSFHDGVDPNGADERIEESLASVTIDGAGDAAARSMPAEETGSALEQEPELPTETAPAIETDPKIDPSLGTEPGAESRPLGVEASAGSGTPLSAENRVAEGVPSPTARESSDAETGERGGLPPEANDGGESEPLSDSGRDTMGESFRPGAN